MYMRNELYQLLLTQEAQSIILLSAFAVVSHVFKMWCGVTRSHLCPFIVDTAAMASWLWTWALKGTSPTDSTGCREGGAADPWLRTCRCSSFPETCAMSDRCPYSMEFRCADVSEMLTSRNVPGIPCWDRFYVLHLIHAGGKARVAVLTCHHHSETLRWLTISPLWMFACPSVRTCFSTLCHRHCSMIIYTQITTKYVSASFTLMCLCVCTNCWHLSAVCKFVVEGFSR